MNKGEIKEVIKKLQKGDNFNYYTNYGYAYSLLISDADTIIDYFEGMEQENNQLKEQIKALEWDNNDKKGIENNYLDLLEENNQLKEKLNCDLKWALKYDGLFIEYQQLKEQRQELRSWLEGWIENEEYCYLATTLKDRCRKDVYQDVLSKLNELEGKND